MKCICEYCNGRGVDIEISCRDCGGSGYDPQEDNPFAQCHTCYGDGVEHLDECPACQGQGSFEDYSYDEDDE